VSVHLDDGDVVLHLGDCVEVMAAMPAESVDAIVTDPPYGLSREPDIAEVLRRWLAGDDYNHRGAGFMGRAWDSFVPGPAVWRECWRVLKPGGHLLAFSGTRTSDLQTIAIRLAGFQIRESLVFLHGSGFPKSLNVSKAIDKAAGAEREVVGDKLNRPGYHLNGHDGGEAFGHGLSSSTPDTRMAAAQITAPATPEAAAWEGWHTALKPAHEPIVMARKPLAERTVAAQVLATGTGAINVDGCRIGWAYEGEAGETEARCSPNARGRKRVATVEVTPETIAVNINPAGRWPANVILDERAAEMLDAAVGESPGPSRFFYTSKASTAERDGATHPTTKPLDLMRWLVRLVTPPVGGVVLDPFAGSGTTLLAARNEGFRAIGIEREAEYAAMCAHRLRQLTLEMGAR